VMSILERIHQLPGVRPSKQQELLLISRSSLSIERFRVRLLLGRICRALLGVETRSLYPIGAIEDLTLKVSGFEPPSELFRGEIDVNDPFIWIYCIMFSVHALI